MKVITLPKPTGIEIDIDVLKAQAQEQFRAALIDVNETDYGETISVYLNDGEPGVSRLSDKTTEADQFKQLAADHLAAVAARQEKGGTILDDARGRAYDDLSPKQKSDVLVLALKRVGVLDEAGRVQ